MLILRIKNLELYVEAMNEMLEIYFHFSKNHECATHSMFQTSVLGPYNLELLQQTSEKKFLKIPIINLNTKIRIEKINKIIDKRRQAIIDVSFNPSSLIKKFSILETSSGYLALIRGFNEIFDNPIYDDSMINQAWGMIIMERIHNS